MLAIDWLSMYQDHPPGSVPVLGSCICFYTDPDTGAVQRQVVHGLQVEGSFDTSIRIRSDGSRVEVSGNPSRYGKPDNVFGIGTMAEAVELYNRILQLVGLPPFSVDERPFLGPFRYQRGEGVVWHGAKVTRVDLCENFLAGSHQGAKRAIRALASMAHRGESGEVFGSGHGVSWGKGSRWLYRKYYLKGPELQRHRGLRTPYVEKLINWCRSQGMVRFEVSLKAMWIAREGLSCPTSWDPVRCRAILDSLSMHGRSETAVSNWDLIADELEALGVPRGEAVRCHHRALAYLGGVDLREDLSRATFYRTRNTLLKLGIDIAAPLDVSNLRFQVDVVRLEEASPPEWYNLSA